MRRLIVIIYLFILSVAILHADNLINNFKFLPVSPELFGTSGNFYLIEKGAYALTANPAGIFTKSRSIYFSHLDYLVDVKSENLAGSFFLKNLKIQISGGFSYQYVSDTKFTIVNDNIFKSFNPMSLYCSVLNFGTAFKLSKNFYVGMLYMKRSLKIIDSIFSSSSLGAGIILDNFLGDFNLGLSVKNILTDRIDKSAALQIPLLSFFDLILGYDDSEAIDGFNVSGILSVKNLFKLGIGYNKDSIKYSGILSYDTLYQIAVSIQLTDIDTIALLSVNIKI